MCGILLTQSNNIDRNNEVKSAVYCFAYFVCRRKMFCALYNRNFDSIQSLCKRSEETIFLAEEN